MRFALAAALLVIAACTPKLPEAEVAQGNWLLPGTTWRLVELGGAPYPARAVATWNVDGRVTGQAPCNRFTAAYSGRWPDVSFIPANATKMACPDLAAETAFFAAIAAVNRASLDDTGLTLTGPDGVELRFERAG